ncbi:hypothetical protein CKO28_20000 [Rhodovibrio sodomensis]|uniref:Uncharacterized protein n=2 Tax=Rhodovibrio sodomensis TaxID=1088 RepID=A0ABS1DK65_9PROT|nr:hypothetical protein [Rhodovibrio sodomensis]
MQTRSSPVPAGAATPRSPVDYSGLTDEAPKTIPAPGETSAPEHGAADHSWGYERGGYGGGAPTLSAARDAADLTDLSHSLGDGARYAVDIAHARDQARAPAAGVAKLRLRQAIRSVRRVCAEAMRQRMHTEMADLAAQIRKMHDRDTRPR